MEYMNLLVCCILAVSFYVPHHLAPYLWILVYFVGESVSVFALCSMGSLCFAMCGACDVSRRRKTVLNSSSRLGRYIYMSLTTVHVYSYIQILPYIY